MRWYSQMMLWECILGKAARTRRKQEYNVFWLPVISLSLSPHSIPSINYTYTRLSVPEVSLAEPWKTLTSSWSRSPLTSKWCPRSISTFPSSRTLTHVPYGRTKYLPITMPMLTLTLRVDGYRCSEEAIDYQSHSMHRQWSDQYDMGLVWSHGPQIITPKDVSSVSIKSVCPWQGQLKHLCTIDWEWRSKAF